MGRGATGDRMPIPLTRPRHRDRLGHVTPTPITMTNDTTQLLGTFSVAKEVTGDFDLESPEFADAEFTILATWDGGSAESS